MTLTEWENLTDRSAFNYDKWDGKGIVFIPDTPRLQDSGCRQMLWNLSDYKVTGVVGGTIWLVKK